MSDSKEGLMCVLDTVLADLEGDQTKGSPLTLDRLEQLLQAVSAWRGSLQHMPGIPGVLLGRTPASLNNVVARPSPVHGTGVFATRDIQAGELVTLYPADAIVEVIGGSMGNCVPSEKLQDFCNGSAKKMKRVLKNQREYRFNVTDTVGIVGFPKFDQNPAYLGHMINDGARANSNLRSVPIYVAVTLKKMNCKFHICKATRHVAVIATRDMKKGEECFVSYGARYWVNPS